MSERRRSVPTQRPLPLSDWPGADREAWQAAQAKAGVLDDGGLASHLSEITRADLTRRYAYFLHFLAQQGRLDRDGHAASVVRPDTVFDYVSYLEPRVSSVTLAQSLYKIARVAFFLSPEQDWRWLRRVVRRLDRRAKPRDRRADVVELHALYQLARRLMQTADEEDSATPFSRALLYRDGLLLALFSADPLRLANMVGLEIGRTLIKDGTSWSFEIPAEETKERRLHLSMLPDWSTPCIDRYLETYRPLFRNAGSTNRLWLSRAGRPLHYNSVYRIVRARTRHAFGKPINPHLFRACLATSTAVHHGGQMGLAITVLRHQHRKVIQRHYNQADMITAVRAYQEILLGDPEPEEE